MKLIVTGSAILLFTVSAWAGTFLENFDNGNLKAWRAFNMRNAPDGTWKIVNKELHAVSQDRWTRLLTIGDETWDDYTIEFEVKPLKKSGPGNIAVAARINGDWAVWCMIGDHPSPFDISTVSCTAGNFRDPTPLFFFGIEPYPPLGLKVWSKLKLAVKENTLNFWINGDHVLGPIQLPNRQTFKQRDAVRKKHLEEHPADENGNFPQFQPMQLGRFQNFLKGSAGLGLSNQTARFDNIIITGPSIPNSEGLSVSSKGKLATLWGSLKRL